jgi:hypothetical protein
VQDLSNATSWPILERLYLGLRQCHEPSMGAQVKVPRGLECEQCAPQPVCGHGLVVVRHSALRSALLALKPRVVEQLIVRAHRSVFS